MMQRLRNTSRRIGPRSRRRLEESRRSRHSLTSAPKAFGNAIAEGANVACISPAGFTIAAAATPPATGGVGILRVSGRDAVAVTIPLAPGLPQTLRPRYAHFTAIADRQGRILDQGLFLYFRAPHSYTGEDVVELHTHGSRQLLQLLQSELVRDGRVRIAEPGEFTRRAFLNGRIDLARAEAVADLVAADSEAAVRAAAHQLQGGLSKRVQEVRQPLVALRADLEGLLNFPVESE